MIFTHTNDISFSAKNTFENTKEIFVDLNETDESIANLSTDYFSVFSHSYADGILTLSIFNNGERNFSALSDGEVKDGVIHIGIVHDNQGNYTEIGCEWPLKLNLNPIGALMHCYGIAPGTTTATIHLCGDEKIEGLPIPPFKIA
ncbi:MAG: hypothetical protein CMO81_09105 [Waddliaceae bacterium]|nr:hypothetical protein [Waddliaceae bacterium]